jgi:hypothetical protein
MLLAIALMLGDAGCPREGISIEKKKNNRFWRTAGAQARAGQALRRPEITAHATITKWRQGRAFRPAGD